MPLSEADSEPDDPPRLHPEIDPAIAEALSDLNSRLEQRGWHARIWVHGDMTAVMVHREGDTEATVDSAIADGRKVLDELAAEIAAERGLPAGWLDRFGSYVVPEPQPPSEDDLTIRQRIVVAVLRLVVRASVRCVAVAKEPDAGRIRKRCALARLGLCRAVLFVLRPALRRRPGGSGLGHGS